jgi:hypothetical protein
MLDNMTYHSIIKATVFTKKTKGEAMESKTTTIRITRESHDMLSSCMRKYGLKACPAVSRAVIHLVNQNPEIFFPQNINKSYTGENEK